MKLFENNQSVNYYLVSVVGLYFFDDLDDNDQIRKTVSSFTILKPYTQPDNNALVDEHTDNWIQFIGSEIIPLSTVSLTMYTQGGQHHAIVPQSLLENDTDVSYEQKNIGATLLTYVRESEKSRLLPDKVLPVLSERLQEKEIELNTSEIGHDDQHGLQINTSNESQNQIKGIEMQIENTQEQLQIHTSNFVRK